MKTTKRTWLLTFAVACGLFLSSALPGQPSDSGGPDAAAQTAGITKTSPADTEPTPEAEDQAASETSTNATGEKPQATERVASEAIVIMGQDVELKTNETAEAVVVIGGSARIHGKVRDAVVAIGGNIEVDGEVGEAAVAVMGNIKAEPGAKIHGDAVAVGGRVEAADGALIEGHKQTLAFGVPGLATPEWLGEWFRQCVLKLRPLAPQVGWIWWIVGGFFLFYVLLAALFPRPVQACVDELTRRPATTFLMGLLTKLLVPLVILILIATGIGLFVVPFVLAAVFLGALLGKLAILEALGGRLLRQVRNGSLVKPLACLVVGWMVVTLLYMVPVLGLLTMVLISVWGLGGAVTAAFAGLRREMPEKQAAPRAMPAPAPTAVPVPVGGGEFSLSATASPGVAAAADLHVPPAGEIPPIAPIMPEALSYPKAGFWERMGAAFLDVVLVSIVGGLVGGPPWGFLVALAYFAGMWTWKGTTIGGIVLGLKVARADGTPVTFAVALVRALAAAFSVIVLFLGFLWIAWDREKQGWHDKIAGTVVVRLPRGTPLVCV